MKTTTFSPCLLQCEIEKNQKKWLFLPSRMGLCLIKCGGWKAELVIFTDSQVMEQPVVSSNLCKEGPVQKLHVIPLKCSREGGMQELLFLTSLQSLQSEIATLLSQLLFDEARLQCRDQNTSPSPSSSSSSL